MKVKKFDDLTCAEAENLIQCRDENNESLCKRGCKFHFPPYYCIKNMFFGTLFNYCREKGLLTDESGEWEIKIESEDTE